jgi:hypothetical protein
MKRLFPLVDIPTGEEFKRIGARVRSEVRGKMTGEFRNPTKGEWFLSGAIPEAYKANANMRCPYYILRLVRVANVTLEVE